MSAVDSTFKYVSRMGDLCLALLETAHKADDFIKNVGTAPEVYVHGNELEDCPPGIDLRWPRGLDQVSVTLYAKLSWLDDGPKPRDDIQWGKGSRMYIEDPETTAAGIKAWLGANIT